MARQPRCAVAGLPHLVALRLLPDVAARMTDAERDLQRRLLGVGLASGRVAVHAYCLGTERTLLLLTPQEASAAAKLVQDLGRRLAVDFNRRHRRAGPIFSGRFRSTVIDARAYLVDAMRYVEQLPLRESGAAPLAWAWSSAAGHCGRTIDTMLTDHPVYWQLGNTPFEREARYQDRLAEPLDEGLARRFDGGLTGGWPIGDDAFLATVAEQVDRRLVPRLPGRPKKPVAPLIQELSLI